MNSKVTVWDSQTVRRLDSLWWGETPWSPDLSSRCSNLETNVQWKHVGPSAVGVVPEFECFHSPFSVGFTSSRLIRAARQHSPTEMWVQGPDTCQNGVEAFPKLNRPCTASRRRTHDRRGSERTCLGRFHPCNPWFLVYSSLAQRSFAATHAQRLRAHTNGILLCRANEFLSPFQYMPRKSRGLQIRIQLMQNL